MPVADFLLAIAQLGVALAGFSGLIAAIRTTSPDGWHPRDIWSLSWMLGTSIGALVLALLPLWLSLFDLAQPLVYQLSSVVACVHTLALVAVQVRAGRRLTREGFPPRVPFFPFALVSLLTLAGLAAGIGALGGWGAALVPVYAGCLLALLLASVLVLAIFLVLLARAARRE
ncbi:hypothetical protein LF41_97 [Lysobacter dokdonensis DS-58]|uniref:Uncharacterized protein n=1 Tax=Lysobacter dokdonensis DS-58 TaxID=1300345 RepID=A0A0A2WJW0_9GAMM|nr:hypothetical protein [Lysobacter dokdonensis]KGQ19007.1 hypothetical protein LF41_97 [Lysobacter dokdonensis DS-58]